MPLRISESGRGGEEWGSREEGLNQHSNLVELKNMKFLWCYRKIGILYYLVVWYNGLSGSLTIKPKQILLILSICPLKMQLSQLWKRGCEFLGRPYAILGGAMTWVSTPSLVAAISNAGGFGVLASGAMSPEQLRDGIHQTRYQTSFPFGVNLITMHPQLFELIDVCVSNKISHVFLAGGIPSSQSIDCLKAGSCCVIGFSPNLTLARKLMRMRCDALIAEGHEAGGHVGPISTSVLAQEILTNLSEIPIFVAGGIGRGEMVGAYLQMGASGCQLGTRFVCAHESPAHPNFKKAFIEAQSRDTIVTTQLDPKFPVIPVRSIANQASKTFYTFQKNIINEYNSGILSLQEAKLKIEHFWAGALRKAVVEGDVDNGSLMAGQSVGLITQEQSVSDIVQEILTQTQSFFKNYF
jgi:enoyl-[acyl-carrier protein] reductase II